MGRGSFSARIQLFWGSSPGLPAENAPLLVGRGAFPNTVLVLRGNQRAYSNHIAFFIFLTRSYKIQEMWIYGL